MNKSATELINRISGCRICAERFAVTKTAHTPRPVPWLSSTAPVLIAGQAPGARVHASGVPFDDRSGDRLREWLGVDRETFYDRSKFAVLPMAFCFPGYDSKGSDLPPPPVCSSTWHDEALDAMPGVRLKLLVGGYAHKFHLKSKGTVTSTVQGWQDYSADVMPLPHPSWRNSGWMRKNPWFGDELLPELRSRVAALLANGNSSD